MRAIRPPLPFRHEVAVGIELPLTAWLALALRGEALATFGRATVVVRGESVWVSPWVSANAGLGLVAEIP